MKILLLTAFIALSSADLSNLDNYDNPVPQSSYAVPQASLTGISSQLTLPSVSAPSNFNSAASGYNSASSVSTNPVPSLNGAQFGNLETSSNFSAGVSQESSSGVNEGQTVVEFDKDQSVIHNQANEAEIDDSSSAATGYSPSEDASKHLYFFSAPEEEDDEEIEAEYDLPAAPAKKTHKIIFIKAPIYKNQAKITLPAPQIEEKTLVYVLVRKHDGKPKVHFKEAAATVPSKPEVFFIRYKTQKEAEAAVAQIQSTHGASGQVIAHLPVGTQRSAASTSTGGFSLDSLGAHSFVGANFANRISEQKSQNSEETISSQGSTTFGHKTVNSFADTDSDSDVLQQEGTTVSIVEDYTTTMENVDEKVGGSDNNGEEVTTAGLYGGPKYKRFSGKKY